MLAQVLLTEEILQALLSPLQRRRGQVIHNILPQRPLLGDVLEQFLVIDLPAKLGRRAPSNGAAARPGFPANSQGDGPRRSGRRSLGGTISLKAVPWRLT